MLQLVSALYSKDIAKYSYAVLIFVKYRKSAKFLHHKIFVAGSIDKNNKLYLNSYLHIQILEMCSLAISSKIFI